MADASRKQPRLAHSAPPEPLARELREVAGAARAFGEAIRGANVLPDAFPKQPTLDIARVLEALPDGTGEGAYEQLVYARNRLSELRRRHIQTEAAAQGAGGAAAPLTRGERIDQTLTRLVADMGTALDAYRALAARDEDERAEVAGAVISDPEEPEVAATARNAGEAQKALETAAREVRKIVEPTSRVGDDLARQMLDAAGLAGMGRAEAQMRSPVPRWLRRIGEELRDYPNLMRKTAGAIDTTVDLASSGRQVWSDFKKSCFEVGVKTAGSLSAELRRLADKWEGERKKPTSQAKDVEPFTIGKARAMILRGEPPPAAWVPMIDELNLSGERAFADASVLSGLTALTSLNLSFTQVRDVSALAGLTALTSLNLSHTQVTDVSALAGLTALTSLNLAYSPLSDVSALAGLTALKSLYLSNTRVTDVSALARLTALTSLSLSDTQVRDVSALAGLTALKSLNLWNTQVSDVSALAGLTALTSLNLWNTQVSDVSALAGLAALTSLNLRNTQVSDVSALAGLAALTSLNLQLTNVTDLSALKPLTRLTDIFVESKARRAALAATLDERGEIVKWP